MPRSKTGSPRRPIDLEALKRAVTEVIENGKTMHFAAKLHNIAKSTLNRHIELHRNAGNKEFVYESRLKTRQVFTDAEEKTLEEYVSTVSNLNYGLSKDDLVKLAFDFAEANAKKIPRKWMKEKKASRDWLKSYCHRHPSIIFGEPEATTSFSNANIGTFFRNYKDCLTKFKFNPDNIYNVDETIYPAFQSTLQKNLSQGRDKQSGGLTSDEREIGVTMIAAINAAGNHVPPMLIFPQVNFEECMLIGAPPGTIGAANSNGWVTAELFLKYLKHFIAFVKPSSEKNVLLIMDNHDTHISVGAFAEAKRNNVVLLTLPPYTTHKLQPLERTVFGAYRTFFNHAENEWMSYFPERAITIYDIATIIGDAFPKAFSPTNIIEAFKASGIWPLNENVFGHDEFLSSSVAERENTEAEVAFEISEPEKLTRTIKEEVFDSSPTLSEFLSSSVAERENAGAEVAFEISEPEKLTRTIKEKVFDSSPTLSEFLSSSVAERENTEAEVTFEISEPEKLTRTIKEEVFDSSHTLSLVGENLVATTKNPQHGEAAEPKPIGLILEAKDEPDDDFEVHSNSSISEDDFNTSHTEAAQESVLSENITADESFQVEEEQETKWTPTLSQDALTRMQDDIHFIRDHVEANSTRDEFAIFGDLIAHKLRRCKRSYSEITIAQNQIANILFNLSMGDFDSVDPPAKQERNDNIPQPSSTEDIQSTPFHSVVIKIESNP